jgi:hypothetical protein
MSEKDNIKLKTDTLSSRKSSASAGVHVKRKRKIIAKTVTKDPVKTNEIPLRKERISKLLSIQKKRITKKKAHSSVKASEPSSQDIKSPKKQKIDKDEKN